MLIIDVTEFAVGESHTCKLVPPGPGMLGGSRWVLYYNDTELRTLNQYESNFINAALLAVNNKLITRRALI